MPKQLSGDTYFKEIRITPHDQLPITESDLEPYISFIDKLVLCEEGEPNGTPRLHYHGVIETKKSETWVRQVLRKLSHCADKTINGNALFFTRNAHAHTYGYIIKSSHVAYCKGYAQTTLDTWLEQSDEYRKSKESSRKRKQRTREDELAHITQSLTNDLKDGSISRSVPDVISRILALCHQEGYRFPARSQMDIMVLKLIYPYNEYAVRSYYERSFAQ